MNDFETNPVGTMKKLERARSENKLLLEEREEMWEEIRQQDDRFSELLVELAEVKEQRDTLLDVAQRVSADDLIRGALHCAPHGAGPGEKELAIYAANRINSLACLIVNKQAEVLEEFAAEFRARMDDPSLLCIIDVSYIEKRAEELRLQAKGCEL